MCLETKNDRNIKTGRRYEYYIKWSLGRDGWEVQERGKYGFYDRGIDLIATKNGVTRYIQCKGWSFRRYIHEDVVTQFFGSVVAQAGLENLNSIEMYIYSPANPSPYAKDKASKLNVHFIKKPFPIWHRKRKV